MDYNMLYILLITIGAIAVSISIKYLKVKKIINISVDDLLEIVTYFNLSMSVINELNLKYETQLNEIKLIINETMNYVIANLKDATNKNDLAYNYALTLCSQFNVVVTDNRKSIIKALIDIAISNM